jgi:hypothetical protein
MKKRLLLLPAALLLAGLAVPAQADPVVTGNFTIDHCTGTCGPAGTIFGSITLTDTAFGVDFDVKVLNGAAFNFNGNGLNTFNFGVDKTLTAASFSNLTAGYSPVIPAGQQDGFGSFLYGVDNSSHGTSTADLMFTVAGIDFADFVKSTGGDPSVFFTIDVLGPNTKTGLIGVTADLVITPVIAQTPLPGAVWMFGAGLGGLIMMSRRKKKPATPAAV